jgi:cytochrome c biogenesis protein CcmG/thiol:disulfide interchange protein DsbE
MTDTGASTSTSRPAMDGSSAIPVDHRRRSVALLATVVLLAAGLVAIARLTGAPTASTGAAPSVLAVGAPAPALSGSTLDGRPLSLAALRGKPVIVNFWASWCGPCKQEFPAFRAVLGRHQADGLTVLGVLYNDGAAPARDFVAREGATWQTLLDPTGAAARTFEVFGAPESFLVDRSGVVRARILGGLTEASLEQAIGPILR